MKWSTSRLFQAVWSSRWDLEIHRSSIRHWAGFLLLIAMACVPTPVRAQDGELPALEYDQLRSRLDELDAEVSRLKAAPTRQSALADDPNNAVTLVNSEYLPPAPGYFPEAGMMSMQAGAGVTPDVKVSTAIGNDATDDAAIAKALRLTADPKLMEMSRRFLRTGAAPQVFRITM